MARTGPSYLLLLLCLLLCGVWPNRAWAQQDVAQARYALEDALRAYADRLHVDVVYTQRLVRDKSSTCRNPGDEPRAALTCILGGTGLEALWTRNSQAVLKKAPRAAPVKQDAPVRFTLQGQVEDAETGETLAGAHVLLEGRPVGTITNAEGVFAFDEVLAKSQTVQITYLGYQTLRATLLPNAGRRLSFALTPVALTSEAVLVESGHMSRADEEVVPGAVSVLSRTASTETRDPVGLNNWFETILWLPSVQRSAELGGNLIVRGGLPDQNLFLLDGAPIYQPWHAEGRFSYMQNAALDDVRLYTGAMPAAYGGRLSAVVDAHMKNGFGVQPRLSSVLTSDEVRVAVETQLDAQTGLVFSGRRSHPGFFTRQTEETPGRLPLENVSYHDVSAKLTQRLSDAHQVAVALFRSNDHLQVDEQALDPVIGVEGQYKWQNGLYSLSHRYLPSARFMVKSMLYQSRYHAEDQTNALLEHVALLEGQQGLSRVARTYPAMKIVDSGLKLDATYFPGAGHQLQAGFSVVNHRFGWTVDEGVALGQAQGVNAVEGALYAQDTWQPTARWQVQPGLRMGFFSKGNYAHLMPRLYTRYELEPGRVTVKAGYSKQVQYIHQVQTADSDYTFSRWIAAGTDDVKPATGTQITVGLESQNGTGLTFAADVYWRDFINVRLSENQYAPTRLVSPRGDQVLEYAVEEFHASGASKAYGLELLTTYSSGHWQMWGSYTASRALVRPFDTFTNSYRSARFEAPHTLRAALNHRGPHWTLTLAGEMRNGYLADGQVVGSSYAQLRLPVYLRIDAGAGYRFQLLGMKWDAQMQVYNLTNRRNIVGYGLADEAHTLSQSLLTGLSRWPTFRVGMVW